MINKDKLLSELKLYGFDEDIDEPLNEQQLNNAMISLTKLLEEKSKKFPMELLLLIETVIRKEIVSRVT